jgi:prepilin-type N-terminal cleavage/methylation domain-containing protein
MKRFSTDSIMKIPTPHQVINSSKTSHRFQPAFTLVELLVVIAILAILAALLFPLVGSMRIKASSAVSVSNLRNIGTAIVTYAADNNGTLPGPAYSHLYTKFQLAGSTNNLNWILRDYLPSVPQPDNPIPNTQYSPTFDYPAARTDGKNPRSVSKPTYTVYSNVRDSIGTFLPLGYPGTAPPMTTAGLDARDTRYSSASGGKGKKPWITESTHPTAIQNPHGQYRNTLMFDYSVKAIPLSELINPNIP